MLDAALERRQASQAPPAAGVPARLDEMLGLLAAAYREVEASSDAPVRLVQAELELLRLLALARDAMLAILSSHDPGRETLRTAFGGGSARIALVRAVVREAPFSPPNARDPRLASCLAACESVEEVLKDAEALGSPVAALRGLTTPCRVARADRPAAVEAAIARLLTASREGPGGPPSEPDAPEAAEVALLRTCTPRPSEVAANSPPGHGGAGSPPAPAAARGAEVRPPAGCAGEGAEAGSPQPAAAAAEAEEERQRARSDVGAAGRGRAAGPAQGAGSVQLPPSWLQVSAQTSMAPGVPSATQATRGRSMQLPLGRAVAWWSPRPSDTPEVGPARSLSPGQHSVCHAQRGSPRPQRRLGTTASSASLVMLGGTPRLDAQGCSPRPQCRHGATAQGGSPRPQRLLGTAASTPSLAVLGGTPRLVAPQAAQRLGSPVAGAARACTQHPSVLVAGLVPMPARPRGPPQPLRPRSLVRTPVAASRVVACQPIQHLAVPGGLAQAPLACAAPAVPLAEPCACRAGVERWRSPPPPAVLRRPEAAAARAGVVLVERGRWVEQDVVRISKELCWVPDGAAHLAGRPP
ncbi:unnamed protein product [Prorocentrum cordatum]|uniref:Uncharacterized protein n=1 Tax=Prorocentrum cordatum TaxID=2364126 RepID=A0ABN9TPC2_9DINO|nr:unnamed protein product [Polarella glacialis]